MEVLAVLLSLYLVTVNTDLTTIDLLAFSGYKYVGYETASSYGCVGAVVSLLSFSSESLPEAPNISWFPYTGVLFLAPPS